MSTSSLNTAPKKVTTQTFAHKKRVGERITMLTAYDYTLAGILDRSGVDALLVGDSAANVMAGYESTLPITLEQMIYHGAAVVRAVRHALVCIDMPFGSYQTGARDALVSAIEIMKRTGADAVKLEGGEAVAPAIEAITAAGIPVIGHLGLTPQSVHKFGGYGLRAAEPEEAAKIMSDVDRLTAAGCFAIVLEKIPAALAENITQHSTVPIIGIGAGGKTDGQVLVTQDMLGMTPGFKPKFLRQYLDLDAKITEAVQHYIADVEDGSFPNDKEQY